LWPRALAQKTLLSSVAGIPIVVSLLLGGHHNLTRADVEHALSRQMNGTSAGQITRTVHCDGAGRSAGSCSSRRDGFRDLRA